MKSKHRNKTPAISGLVVAGYTLRYLELDLGDDMYSVVRCPVTNVSVRSPGDMPNFTKSPAFLAEWMDEEVDTCMFKHARMRDNWRQFVKRPPKHECCADLLVKFVKKYYRDAGTEYLLVKHGGEIAAHIWAYTLLQMNKPQQKQKN